MLSELTDEEWDDLLKDVFKLWRKTNQLNQHQLTQLRIVEKRSNSPALASDPFNKAKALQIEIREAVDVLGVDGVAPADAGDEESSQWMAEEWRHYNILRLLMDYRHDAVKARVGLEGGHYYDEYGRARAMLTEVLRNKERMPAMNQTTLTLEYPSGALKLDDPLYIERDVDRKLSETLVTPGQTITIRGSRQVGKTSLLARGVQHAEQRFGAKVVYFDLQGAGSAATRSLESLLRVLGIKFLRALNLDIRMLNELWYDELEPQMNLETIIEYAAGQVDVPILLAMDEIDQLQLTTFHTDFFGLLRSWHNLRASSGYQTWNKLTLIMAISTEPYLLIDDMRQSPFNVGSVLYLEDFDRGQVRELNRRYEFPASDNDIESMYGLLGGHPYLSRVAFYTLVVDDLPWHNLEQIAVDDNGPFQQHLQWQYRLVSADPKLREAMYEIVHHNRCSDEMVGFRLMKAGLVMRNGDNYVCRCELYRRYFARRL